MSENQVTKEQVGELQKLIDELAKRVQTLESWKKERESQQLTYPIDYQSQQIIRGIQ